MTENKVDLAGAWSNFIASFGSRLDGFFQLCAFVGVILAVTAFIMWLWQKRRGGKISPGITMMILLGALLASPKAFIPLLLIVVDFVVNLLLTFIAVAF